MARSDYIIFSAILVLAAGLRFYGLNAPLWFDEIQTIGKHVRLPISEMFDEYSMNFHYFYSLQSKLSSALFGPQIWAYRLPATLFGIATVAAIWWLARDIAGRHIAHISALLVALSYHQVWFSQNARGYTELAFWSTLGLILFLRGCRGTGRSTWVLFGLTLAAAVFTHLTAAFFFAALGLLWLGILARRTLAGSLKLEFVTSPLLGAILGIVVIGLLYLPVFPSMIELLGEVSQTSAVDVMHEYRSPVWSAIEGVRTASGQGSIVAVGIILAIATVLGFGTLRAHAAAPLFAPAIGLHICLTIIGLNAMDMRIWPRFFFVDIGLVLVLIIIGCAGIAETIARLTRHQNRELHLFTLAVLAMSAISVVLVARNYTAPKQDLRSAMEFVESNRQPGEKIYAIGPGGEVYSWYFGADWGQIGDPEAFREAMAGNGQVTLVVPFADRMLRRLPEMKASIGIDLELNHRFRGTLGDGAILVLKRN